MIFILYKFFHHWPKFSTRTIYWNIRLKDQSILQLVCEFLILQYLIQYVLLSKSLRQTLEHWLRRESCENENNSDKNSCCKTTEVCFVMLCFAFRTTCNQAQILCKANSRRNFPFISLVIYLFNWSSTHFDYSSHFNKSMSLQKFFIMTQIPVQIYNWAFNSDSNL